MFGAHLPELMIVMVLALIVFGPKRLPEIGSSLGRGIRDFKKHVSGDGLEAALSAHHPDTETPLAHVSTTEPVVVVESESKIPAAHAGAIIQ